MHVNPTGHALLQLSCKHGSFEKLDTVNDRLVRKC